MYYDFRRPELTNVTFSKNNALYGNDVASYPVRIVNYDRINDPIILTNVASGISYSETLRLSLVDFDNQIMNLVSTSQIKISAVSNGTLITGVVESSLSNGQADFEDLQFISQPGEMNIEFIAN